MSKKTVDRETGTATTASAIERLYPNGELETATPARRLGAFLLDTFVFVLTLGIGWLVWFAIVAGLGRTPGKQMTGIYIIAPDGSQAGGRQTLARELLVKWSLFLGVPLLFTFWIEWAGLIWVVAAVWCTWDVDAQCLWDKVARTYVAHSPRGGVPRRH